MKKTINDNFAEVVVTSDACPILRFKPMENTWSGFKKHFPVIFALTPIIKQKEGSELPEIEHSISSYILEDSLPKHIRLEIFKFKYPEHASKVKTWEDVLEVYKTMNPNPQSYDIKPRDL